MAAGGKRAVSRLPQHLEGYLTARCSQGALPKFPSRKSYFVLQGESLCCYDNKEGYEKANKLKEQISLDQVCSITEMVIYKKKADCCIKLVLQNGAEIDLFAESNDEVKQWVKGLQQAKETWTEYKKRQQACDAEEDLKQIQYPETEADNCGEMEEDCTDPDLVRVKINTCSSGSPPFSVPIHPGYRVDELITAAIQRIPARSYDHCHTCQLRRSMMEVWTVDHSGQAHKLDADATVDTAGVFDCFYLLEHSCRLLIVHFEDGTFVARPAEISIKAKDIPYLFSSKLSNVDLDEFQLYLEYSSKTVRPFAKDECPLRCFWESKNGAWNHVNQPGGRLLLKRRAIDMNKINQSQQESRLNKVFQDRKNQKALKQIEKQLCKKAGIINVSQQVRYPATSHCPSVDTSPLSSGVDNYALLEASTAVVTIETGSKPSDSRNSHGQLTVPLCPPDDFEEMSDWCLISTTKENVCAETPVKKSSNAEAKQHCSGLSNARNDETVFKSSSGTLRRIGGVRRRSSKLSESDTSSTEPRHGDNKNTSSTLNQKHTLKDRAGNTTDTSEIDRSSCSDVNNDCIDDKSEYIAHQQPVNEDCNVLTEEVSSCEVSKTKTGGLAEKDEGSGLNQGGGQLLHQVTLIQNEKSDTDGSPKTEFREATDIAWDNNASSHCKMGENGNNASSMSQHRVELNEHGDENPKSYFGGESWVEKCMQNKSDLSDDLTSEPNKICLKDDSQLAATDTVGENEGIRNECVNVKAPHLEDQGAATKVSDACQSVESSSSSGTLSVEKHTCAFYAIKTPYMLKTILRQYTKLRQGEEEVGSLPRTICVSGVHLINRNRTWILMDGEKTSEIPVETDDQEYESFELGDDITVLHNQTKREWIVKVSRKSEEVSFPLEIPNIIENQDKRICEISTDRNEHKFPSADYDNTYPKAAPTEEDIACEQTFVSANVNSSGELPAPQLTNQWTRSTKVPSAYPFRAPPRTILNMGQGFAPIDDSIAAQYDSRNQGTELKLLEDAVQNIFYHIEKVNVLPLNGLDDRQYPVVRTLVCRGLCSALAAILRDGLKKRLTLKGYVNFTPWNVVKGVYANRALLPVILSIKELGVLSDETRFQLFICECLNKGQDLLALWVEGAQNEKRKLLAFYEETALMVRTQQRSDLEAILSRLSCLPFKLSYFAEIRRQILASERSAFNFE